MSNRVVINQKGFLPFIEILIILIVLGAAAGAYLVYHNGHNPKPVSKGSTKPVVHVTLQGVVTFDSCFDLSSLPCGDVGRSIKVDGITVNIAPGNVIPREPWGDVINAPTGSWDGHRVEVFAKVVNSTTQSLEGSTSYYCKFTN